MKKRWYLPIVASIIIGSCSQKDAFKADFDSIHDRVWIGEDYWTIPMEDWKVRDGRVECTSTVPDARMMLLTRVLSAENGDFKVSAKMGLLDEAGKDGTAGFLIGLFDEQDPDVKAACYFGKGLSAGISLSGKLSVPEVRSPLNNTRIGY